MAPKALLEVLVLLALASAAIGHELDTAQGCSLESPRELLPDPVKKVRIGMSKAELEELMDAPDYSPIAGQYYFSTDGDCPVEDSGREAPCGLVAGFRSAGGRASGQDESLEFCWWGAIAE